MSIRTRRCIGSYKDYQHNSLLEQERDNLQQYQCRACIIVNNITLVKDETEEQIMTKTKSLEKKGK